MLTFEPDPSHYQSCGALATCCEGAGSVHLARHLPSGNLVALKKFNMERAGDDAALVQHEVRLTRQLRHPHVLGLHAAFVAGPHVVAVLPLMAFGSCRDLLNAHFANGLPEAAVACVLSDALLGLEYIHRRGIVHRAVRASHILVSGSGRACLSGLRYSCPLVENGRWQKALHSFPQSTARNLNWLSPENLQGYNEKSDVYSLGVTACELANGAIPFADMPTTLMLTEKVRGCCPQLLDCSTVAECDDDGPGTNEGNGGSGSDAGLLHHGADDLASMLAAERLSELDMEPDQWDF
ncbi:Putative serine/threonine-protein kinase STE20-like [Gryllus bimaculatus]|nr:Putative serine/threonine-protein kinase STE20-like [Gryllus bimaculatus]